MNARKIIFILFLFYHYQYPVTVFPFYLNNQEKDVLTQIYNNYNSEDIKIIKQAIKLIRVQVPEVFQIYDLKLLKKTSGQSHIIAIIAKKFKFLPSLLNKIQKLGLEYYNYYTKYKNFYILYFDSSWIYQLNFANAKLGIAQNISYFNVEDYLNLNNEALTQIQVRVYSLAISKKEKNQNHREDLFLFLMEPGKKTVLKRIFSHPLYFFTTNKKKRKEKVIEYILKFKNIDQSPYNEVILHKKVSFNYYKKNIKKNLQRSYIKKLKKNFSSSLHFYYDSGEKLIKKLVKKKNS